MLMEDSEKMDLEVNELSLIDFSSENDNLIGNSSSPLPSWGLEEYPSSGATNSQEEMDMARKGNNDEQFPQLHESKEPEKAGRKGKVNLRKSLAWDSAFFTDAGVLDAEELSSMIKGGDKPSLPMIEEDVQQSFDSISTLESEDLALEHIEAELFGDIRASIQKVTIPSSGDASEKRDNGAISSAKKVDLASKDRMKPKLAPKRIIGAQAGIPKSQPKQITGTQRLGKGLNQDKAQVTQSISRTTSGASLKPPKISTKLQPVSASKRASLDITRVKTDNDSTKTSSASVRGAQTQKASASNKASRILPKPTMSMKPSSVGSSPAMKIHPARSSSDSSGSTSSDKTAKSLIPAARRKVVNSKPIAQQKVDNSKPIAQPSASAKLKTPSKVALKSKLPSGNSAVSAYLMSSKINSSISPASSVSDWSSISSSSSATINQRSSKLRTSFDTSSCRSFDSDTSTLDLKNHLSDQTSDKPEIRGTIPRESLKQAGTVSRPASMMKPSGLRMPSPKMGYFDGVKAVRTPNGTHSSSSTALPKTEATICSPKGNSNSKAKSVKVPLRATRKPETLKHVSPVSSSDKSNISDNHSGASLPKTEATVCSPKGNSNSKAKSTRVPLRANRKPETLKHLSPVSSSDKSNVLDSHAGAPSDITLISELSLEVHHETSGANTSKNMDVLAEEPDPFEHIQSAGLVASKSENQGIASTLNSEEVVAEGPDTVEHVTYDGLVAIKSENKVIVNNDIHEIKSENQIIANTLNNEEVVAEGPDTVDHVAADGLVANKSENEVIANDDTVLIKSESQSIASALNNKEDVAEGPDAVEHVSSDGLVAIKSENQVIMNNDPDVIKSENQRIEEVMADEPDAIEHVAGNSSVAIKSENQVIVNNDTNVIESENQRIEEVVADEPGVVEHIAGDGLVAIKSENQVVVNDDTNVIKSANQRIEEVVADESDSVEHVVAGLAAIKGEKQGVMENEMNSDTIGNIVIKAIEVTISEHIRQCQTEDGDGVGIQGNVNYNLDVPSQMNEMNLEDNVNGDFKNTKIDHVEREYDSTSMGAETMPQCQTGNEGRVDVKDDLDTLEETNAEKTVCANQADQLNSQVEEVSTTPFCNKVESLMNRLAYLSLNTPEIAVRRMPFAVKNSSDDCLDFCEGAQVVGKTGLDLPSLDIDHKENNNL
ncbi:uncharacterized protein LOC132057249 [Lycium ferocissimum]|uniref:uncharacterized protein LOC132057249 n=1 Tax=Lycium ferocissimum TaxID=112874 RepID=UPI002815A7EE|nr:uncharacterized protein LOC132057249 [Lycium ferocissimum]